ncbi:FtsQ-type POTRA domain-containing protein [Patescibacteria group bacterium]|nr:FtsQ-type POTRA domain-containing protein [Patescibacteria group bacterium]
MKLFKFIKQRKNKNIKRDNFIRQTTPARRTTYSTQTKESQLLLNKIKSRKRNVINHRKVLRKKHGVFKKIAILLFLLGSCTFLFIKFEVADYFKISHIDVRGAGQFVSPEDIKNIIQNISSDQYIFLFNEEEAGELISKNFLGVKSFQVSKKYPNTLLVELDERVPLAIVYNNKDENYLIDSEGYVLGTVEEGFSNLPEIKYEGVITIGTFLEKEIIPISIDILKFADQEDIKISSMSFFPKYARVFLDGDTEVLLGYDKDNEKSLKVINAILKDSRLNDWVLKKIDLRYDKVIVL